MRQLCADAQGVSIIEFALMLPLLILIGATGLEMINYVLANQKIERIASITADNIARNTLRPSERSFVDSFAAVNDIGKPFDVLADGRVIITGVVGVQEAGRVVGKVVWQRCSGGLPGRRSRVGSQPADPGRWAEGPTATLPNNIPLLQNQMVVVSEVSYRYTPLVSLAQLQGFTGSDIINQTSVFVARGQVFTSITPVTGVTPATCG